MLHLLPGIASILLPDFIVEVPSRPGFNQIRSLPVDDHVVNISADLLTHVRLTRIP
jgi:hypothetical protein